MGDCTSRLVSGSSCHPSCSEGYKVSGTSLCFAGVLLEATCQPFVQLQCAGGKCPEFRSLRLGGTGGKCSYVLKDYVCMEFECRVLLRALQPECGSEDRLDTFGTISKQAFSEIVAANPGQPIIGTVVSYGDGEIWPSYNIVVDFAP